MSDLPALLLDSVQFDPHAGCWLWDGDISPRGYALRNRRLVHRLVLTETAGAAPDGKPLALHRCDVRCCINPGHLYWGDATDNSADVMLRGRAAHCGPATKRIRKIGRDAYRLERDARHEGYANSQFNRALIKGLTFSSKERAAITALADMTGLQLSDWLGGVVRAHLSPASPVAAAAVGARPQCVAEDCNQSDDRNRRKSIL